jgi:SAM-dependent methyltransferase
MNATDVQLAQAVGRTPEEILDRYRSNRHWRFYEKEWIYRNIPVKGRTWLDFGCGTGEITTQLALLGAARVIGLDVTPGLLEQTRRRAELDQVADRVDVVCGDILSVEPRPVDVALSFAVLHHLPDRFGEAIPAIKRWIKPGGLFVCVEPVCYVAGLEWIRQRSGVPQDELDPGERKLSEADLRQIEKHFSHSERVHFRVLSRLGRVWPRADRWARRADRWLLSAPGVRFVAGTVVMVCK